MEVKTIRETLETQLQLLSKRSQKVESVAELCELTNAMTRLISAPWPLA